MDFQGPVVFDEAELAKLVHKHAHARPRGADHLGDVSWLIFAMTGSGLLSLPKFAISRSTLARRFSLELKSWSTKSSSTRAFRANRYDMNISEKFGSSCSTRTMAAFSIRM